MALLALLSAAPAVLPGIGHARGSCVCAEQSAQLLPPLCARQPRSPTPAMLLSDDAKRRMVQAGLAVPGMEAEGRAVARNISSALDSAGVGYVEIGRDFATVTRRDALSAVAPPSAPPSAEPKCTRADPCPVDGDLLGSLVQTSAPIVLLVAFAYAAGTQAATSDEEWLDRLEERAERSRKRRLAALRDLGGRLEPVQAAFGWSLVDERGLPTALAYGFLALALAAQLALAAALSRPLQELLGQKV